MKFKQANPKRPEVHNMDVALGTQYGQQLDARTLQLLLRTFQCQLRTLLYVGRCGTSFPCRWQYTLPKSTKTFGVVMCSMIDLIARHTVDSSQQCTVVLNSKRGVTPTGSWLYTEWILNNKDNRQSNQRWCERCRRNRRHVESAILATAPAELFPCQSNKWQSRIY